MLVLIAVLNFTEGIKRYPALEFPSRRNLQVREGVEILVIQFFSQSLKHTIRTWINDQLFWEISAIATTQWIFLWHMLPDET